LVAAVGRIQVKKKGPCGPFGLNASWMIGIPKNL